MEIERYYGRQEAPAPAQEATLREYLEILDNRRWIIAVIVALCVIAAAAYIAVSPAVFQSKARLLIEAPQGSVMRRDTSDPFGDIYVKPAPHDVTTQMEVLQGASLLNQAYKDAGVPPGSVELEVKRVYDTDVVEILVNSTNPKHAQKMARTLPATYIQYTNRNEKSGVTSALQFARGRLNKESRALDEAELALQRFRDRSRIASLDSQRENRIDEASLLSNNIAATEMSIRGLTRQMQELQATRRSQPGYVDTPVISTNVTITDLQDKIAELRNERARMIILYKPSHAKVQEIDARLKDYQDRLARLPKTKEVTTRTVNPMLAEYDKKIAETRAAISAKSGELATARDSHRSLTADIQRFNSLERQESALKRAIEKHRQSVGLLTTSVESLEIQRQTNRAPVITTSPATAPEKVAPNVPALLVAAVMGGLLLGVCIALVHATLDTRINSTTETRRLVGSPVMGFIPALRAREERRLDEVTGASVLDSYRVLRTNVEAAITDGSVKSILLSSTLRGEGKSSTAANLAIALAQDGRRVVLVDADLRAPSMHRLFNLRRAPGLSNVLFAHVSLIESLQSTNVRDLWVLTAGLSPSHPAELLNSPVMRQVHDQLREFADVIIIDGPPIFGAADALVMAAEADAVLYVVGHGENRKPWLSQSMDLLHQVRANVLGVVLNKVPRRTSPYGYGSYPYGELPSLPYRSVVPLKDRAEEADLPEGMEGLDAMDAMGGVDDVEDLQDIETVARKGPKATNGRPVVGTAPDRSSDPGEGVNQI